LEPGELVIADQLDRFRDGERVRTKLIEQPKSQEKK
jgi:hypothetical protein